MAFRVSLMCALLAASGCELVRGPEGPQGDIGPAGPAGEPGEPGEDGRSGEDGDAGILYTDWFEPDYGSWEYGYRLDTLVWSLEVAVPELDDDIINNGVVLVYAQLDGYRKTFWPLGRVVQLPFTIDYLDGDRYTEDHWSYHAEVGTLTLELTNSWNLYFFAPANHRFRFLLIPGGTQLAQEDVDEIVDLPYDEAMEWLAEQSRPRGQGEPSALTSR